MLTALPSPFGVGEGDSPLRRVLFGGAWRCRVYAVGGVKEVERPHFFECVAGYVVFRHMVCDIAGFDGCQIVAVYTSEALREQSFIGGFRLAIPHALGLFIVAPVLFLVFHCCKKTPP